MLVSYVIDVSLASAGSARWLPGRTMAHSCLSGPAHSQSLTLYLMMHIQRKQTNVKSIFHRHYLEHCLKLHWNIASHLLRHHKQTISFCLSRGRPFFLVLWLVPRSMWRLRPSVQAAARFDMMRVHRRREDSQATWGLSCETNQTMRWNETWPFFHLAFPRTERPLSFKSWSNGAWHSTSPPSHNFLPQQEKSS